MGNNKFEKTLMTTMYDSSDVPICKAPEIVLLRTMQTRNQANHQSKSVFKQVKMFTVFSHMCQASRLLRSVDIFDRRKCPDFWVSLHFFDFLDFWHFRLRYTFDCLLQLNRRRCRRHLDLQFLKVEKGHGSIIPSEENPLFRESYKFQVSFFHLSPSHATNLYKPCISLEMSVWMFESTIPNTPVVENRPAHIMIMVCSFQNDPGTRQYFTTCTVRAATKTDERVQSSVDIP